MSQSPSPAPGPGINRLTTRAAGGVFSFLLAATASIVLGTNPPAMRAEPPGKQTEPPEKRTEPPVIPVGLDAYRQWDRWYLQRIGVRAYMRSTYDRTGGNKGADSSHFLYQTADDFNVTLDVLGPGVLYFARYNHWHGSPWHYEVDGRDFIVQETGTADPVNARKLTRTVFLPEKAFPPPLTWTWPLSKGADLMWVPIPFERSFRMAYGRTHYGTGYYIYHLFDPSAKLSQPIRSWTIEDQPAPDVLELLRRSGSDLIPEPDSPEGRKLELKAATGQGDLPAGQMQKLVELTQAPSVIRAVEFFVPRAYALAFGRASLRITWDNRAQPSVEAPVALFFGAGTLFNRRDAEYLVQGFPMFIRFEAEGVRLSCFFPMPFYKSARIELVGAPREAVANIRWRIRYMPLREPPSHVGYFHATYSDHPTPEWGHDLLLLDTRGAEGVPEWSGSFVGMSWIFTHRGELTTLEGDPRFFFDDSQTPQAQGTGTEEWGGGGDYWKGGQTSTLPLAGHPCGAPRHEKPKTDDDLIHSAYRFLLADLFPFGRRAIIRLEHGGQNESTEHYQAVVYWYGAPAPALVLTDRLKIGDPHSEKSHRYVSPQASAPYQITSRYEWGPDEVRKEPRKVLVVYPEQTDTARKTRGTSEFTIQLRPDNWGVLLRRKLDYAYPHQRADVYVAEEIDGQAGEFQKAGTWYLAGSSTCVYSRPPEERGQTQHIVVTSNRRFRDDEFIIPASLTRGRSRLRVRLQCVPVERPLFPGYPLTETAWTEIAYTAYCWVLPEWKP